MPQVSSFQNQWLLLDFFIQAHPLEYHILFKLLTSWPHAQPRRARYLFWKYLDTTTLFLFGLKQANYDWGLSGGKKGLPGWSFQHLSAIPKFNHHLRCPSVLGGATCKHLRGKGRDPEASDKFAAKAWTCSWNVKLSEKFDSFIFNMCLVWWNYGFETVIYNSLCLIFAAVFFQSWQKS